ncbi:TIGR04104 family putative zinc finger protein [Bacillus sp. 1P02SD]|uniref:TIGR04104 family putative zinc finger protein n=1 Tax=Bacillus sp. 1P02SD TaxID=3132264 RepID=UPI00399F667E
MPTCQKCNKKWSWKQTFKKSFTLTNALTCPNCGEKQYITPRTRKISTVISFIATFLGLFLNFYFDSPHVVLFIMLGFLSLIIVIYPFYLETSNKEEPLFG